MSNTVIAALGLTAALAMSTAPATAASSSATLATQTPKMSDKAIQDHIEYRLESSDMVGRYDIKVKVDAGLVSLSGDVRTIGQKTECERLAKVDGVSKVVSEIKVNADIDKSVEDRAKKGLNKAGVAITDAWIAAKIHWFFVGEDLLKDSDIKVDTAKGVVTLGGTVKTPAGRLRATKLAERTDGVKSVIVNITIGGK